MPLSLPNPRQDRPRRRIEPLEPPLREAPLRTYSFDPNAARQAWRQVARTRGANAWRLDGREPGTGRLAMVALGLVAAAALLLWWTSDDDARTPEHAVVEVATAETSPSHGAGPSRPGLLPEPTEVEPPMPAGASSFANASEEVEPPQPRVERVAPPGTLEGNAKALRKLPHASTDRAPLGGIGPEGMHADRIGMGTSVQDGACMGPTGKFSVRDDHHAHVCFRVVHTRIKGQRVVVRWERGGTLVRRTVVPIADSHAYRTRATLPLRRTFRGDWTVRIVSTDGIELAAHSFQVL
jgi:hypothetical protein